MGRADPSITSHDLLVPPSAWNPHIVGAGATAGGNGSNRRRSNASSEVDGTTDLGSNSYGSDYAPSSPMTSRHETSKTAEGPSRLRPLNIIQHEDGGLVPNTPAAPAAEEVVELPPSYNDVRQAAGNAPGAQ
jgi:hypothetical protein